MNVSSNHDPMWDKRRPMEKVRWRHRSFLLNTQIMNIQECDFHQRLVVVESDLIIGRCLAKIRSYKS